MGFGWFWIERTFPSKDLLFHQVMYTPMSQQQQMDFDFARIWMFSKRIFQNLGLFHFLSYRSINTDAPCSCGTTLKPPTCIAHWYHIIFDLFLTVLLKMCRAFCFWKPILERFFFAYGTWCGCCTRSEFSCLCDVSDCMNNTTVIEPQTTRNINTVGIVVPTTIHTHKMWRQCLCGFCAIANLCVWRFQIFGWEKAACQIRFRVLHKVGPRSKATRRWLHVYVRPPSWRDVFWLNKNRNAHTCVCTFVCATPTPREDLLNLK